MSVDYLLHESSVGYGIFRVKLQADSIGARLKEVQDGHQDLSKFGKMVELVSFAPFAGASQALENANDISEGIVSEYLKTVLEANLPKGGKKEKKKVVLGVWDKNLAGSIKAEFPGVDCETADTSEVAADLLRGLRTHAEKLLKGVQDGDVSRAQLGLGHAYSRAKVKFSVQKNDNHIIQAIATLDHLDKAVNLFAMRVREWYGWHFPELVKIVSDNHTYARCALLIQDKKTLSEDSIDELVDIVDDEVVARAIVDAARVSMGQDISEADMENVMNFAKRAVSMANYRKHLSGYLNAKMGVVAPNLAALIGETVGARLISKAGSLTNLAKYPASTVQILGAEKALFRALKTKGNTPKYGLIYHSSFIGRAGMKNKGRISRFLANKASIASRIDNFSMAPNRKFGEALKEQVEERLRFYAEGVNPTKNEDAMKATIAATEEILGVADPTATGGAEAEEEIAAPGVTDQGTEHAQREKKDKKKKKKDRESLAASVDVAMTDADDAEALRKKLKKEKKEKRKSEGGADGESSKKKKKSKA